MSDELNPYESPKTEPEDNPKLGRDPYYVTYPLQSTRGMGMTCRVLLGLFGALCLLLAIWNLKLAHEYDITDDYEGLSFLSFEQMSSIESAYQYLLFGSMIAVALWKYRSMKNAWGIMKTGVQPTVSPGWSLAWYIIPIASLWKPFTAMSEINRNSTDEPSRLKYWLRFWWALWLLSFFFPDGGYNVSENYDATNLQKEAFSELIIGAAAICLERVIARITACQMEEYDKSIISKL